MTFFYQKNMRAMLSLFLMSFFVVACGNGSSTREDHVSGRTDSPQLVQVWTTDSTLLIPESVLWIPGGNFFYVSEVDGNPGEKDGKGFIAKVDSKGHVLNTKWISGLNAPKGMGIYGDTLYVADIDQLVLIDTKKDKVIRKINLPGASFLNDVAVALDGRVFVSDTQQGKVYQYVRGEVSVLLKGPEVKGANGLLIRNEELWMLSSEGIFVSDFKGTKPQLFSDAVKGGDGITALTDSTLIVSKWVGEIYYVSADGTALQLLDTKKEGNNAADLDYIPSLKLLIVPTFGGKSLTAYRFKQ